LYSGSVVRGSEQLPSLVQDWSLAQVGLKNKNSMINVKHLFLCRWYLYALNIKLDVPSRYPDAFNTKFMLKYCK